MTTPTIEERVAQLEGTSRTHEAMLNVLISIGERQQELLERQQETLDRHQALLDRHQGLLERHEELLERYATPGGIAGRSPPGRPADATPVGPTGPEVWLAR